MKHALLTDAVTSPLVYTLKVSGRTVGEFKTLKAAEDAGDALLTSDRSLDDYTVVSPCGAPLLTVSEKEK